MPAEFAVDDAGRVLAQIADAKGELHEYEMALVTWDLAELLAAMKDAGFRDPPAPEWACRLIRLDTEAVHYCAKLGPARWFCSCADRTYRRRMKPDGCKHTVAARAMFALCRFLSRSSKGVPA